ncbi:MAG TPA: hypothetical protein VKV40_05285 [Ktedonobacteraceae bacterium]|nr:hypothetical protein [Ktedonobacteraceae bacterium]
MLLPVFALPSVTGRCVQSDISAGDGDCGAHAGNEVVAFCIVQRDDDQDALVNFGEAATGVILGWQVL